MNVRQRAKTFEALMSDSCSPENERKRSQDDFFTERAGDISSNGQKQSGQGTIKPVPPPRKKRNIVPSRTERPGVQLKTPSKTSSELQKTQLAEKTKAAGKKPPPPRPAPYRQLPSSLLMSHIPPARTKELSASLSRRRQLSEGIESPKSSLGGSPKATPKPHAREHPVKPPRRSPKSSPKLSLKVSNGDPEEVSSCEIEIESRIGTPGSSPEKGKKGHPKRPPPPKTSSLIKKPKPPVPPKPKRPPKPDVEQEKKSATIPRAGSIESKEALSECPSGHDEDMSTKQRSLSSPLSKYEINQQYGENDEMQSFVADEGDLKIDDEVELSNISVPEKSDSFRDDNGKMSDGLPKQDEVNIKESQNNADEQQAFVSAKEETLSDADLNTEITGADVTESMSELEAVSSSSIDNENGTQLSELEESKPKEIADLSMDATIVHTDLEFHHSSVFGVGVPTKDLHNVENVQGGTNIDFDALAIEVEGDNEGFDGRIHISESIETDIDSEILHNNSKCHQDEHIESLRDENSPCNEGNLQKSELSSVNPTITSGDLCEEFKCPEEVKEDVGCIQDEAHTKSFETGVLTMKENFAEDVPLTKREIDVIDKLSTAKENHEDLLEETSIDVIECHANGNGLLMAKNSVNESPVEKCTSNAEERFCDDEQFTHERQEFEIENSSEAVADIKDLKDFLTSNVSSDSIPNLCNPSSAEKRTSYLETSLDGGFFNDDDVNDSGISKEDFNRKQSQKPSDDVLNQPYETHIDLDVVNVISEDQSRDTLLDSSQECPSDVWNVMEETESKKTEVTCKVQAEEPHKLEGSVKVAQYENVVMQQPNESDLENSYEEPLSPQPIKPSRPSRLKKRHTYENTSLSPTEEAIGDTVEAVESVESENSKKFFRRTDVYENASIIQAQDKIVGVDKSKPNNERTSNRFDSYENAVVIRQSTVNVDSHAEAVKTSKVFPDLKSSYTENKQADVQKSNYENVVFEEDTLEEVEGVYQVPRRNSFHSESPTSSLVRLLRSASVGSIERKKGGINDAKRPLKRKSGENCAYPGSGIACSTEKDYVIPKSIRVKSDADNVYVAPRSLNTPLTESYITTDDVNVTPKSVSTVATNDVYVTPKSVSTVATDDVYVTPKSVSTVATDDVYVTPKSVISVATDDVYVTPKSVSTVATDVYVTPKSVSTVATDDVYVTPKSIRSNSDETQLSEVERKVPSSLNEEMPNADCELSRSASDPEVEGYSTIYPATGDIDSTNSRRSNRSSVVTSREQLRTATKNVPQKPPRSSFDDSQTKPRSSIDQSSEIKEEKDEHEEPVASPKPKRPAPPRPKAPSFSVPVDKSPKKTDTESKHKAPPRPPPPPLNRVSGVPSEQDSLPASPLDSSSDSEDERSPVPTGPPKKKTYHIAHEILSTEKTFVTALTLCYEDCYGMIKEADVVPESTLNHIFKDLGNIYHLDVKFLNELEERMRTWDENERIGDIVRKYSHFLRMYTTYINHYDKAISFLQETVKENLQFADLVQQFQASDKCQGLFLESFMLKPVQRIPSYRLLLIDYLKHLQPDSDEFQDIKVALDIVSEVATHINESMKQSDNFQRVLSIQESLVGNEEIVKPGREFIKEGTLQKLCRKDMQERTFFLLTDVLLYTSAVAGGQYKLKGTFPLLGIKVALPDSPEFENEFSIISKSRSFTLSASTQAERDEWIEELDKAVSALTKKKSTFLLSKDKAVALPEEDEEESKLGDKAPVWIQDTRVTMCMLCTDKFTVTNRRHHCRGCGKVVCGSCSDNLAPLAYLDYSQARVCDICYEVLLKDQNKSIKEVVSETEPLPHSPVGISADDLDRIHRKPPKFEILHRFKSGSRRNHRRSKIFTSRPSVRTEVVGHDSESQMSGYLRFKRTNKHGWKRLWFVLKDNVLYTYKASEDVVAMETIPILGYDVQEATRTEGDEIQFQLKHPGLPPISFKTETESSAYRWIQELRKATTL